MSRKFWAEDRKTGARWKPSKAAHQYLVLYDSGYLAVVTDYGWDGISVAPLDNEKWKLVWASEFRDKEQK